MAGLHFCRKRWVIIYLCPHYVVGELFLGSIAHMTSGPLDVVLRHLRTVVAAESATTQTDGQLLRRFAAGRDEAAFAVLLKRHGPMVLGVSRRVLRSVQDAEDVFQATFL